MGGVVGDVKDKSTEVGGRAKRDGFEIGRKLKLDGVDTVVGDRKAASESVGMRTVESIVAVDAVGGLEEAVVERRDLRIGRHTKQNENLSEYESYNFHWLCGFGECKST